MRSGISIRHLGFSPKGFAEVRDLLPGVSEKVLIPQLRRLVADGVVDRDVVDTSPPKVTCSLTPAGREMLEPMRALCAWGTRHLGIPPNLPRYPSAGPEPLPARS